jgi:hypothetical protein
MCTHGTLKHSQESGNVKGFWLLKLERDGCQSPICWRTEGRVEIILKLLATRYGALSPAVEAHVRATSSTELDRVAERVLTARTVQEALGTPCA